MLDDQAQHIRVFDSDGVYVRTLGRRGEGPGELTRAESIALLPDGRVVVRDPGNMRVQVFGPGPEERDQWGYNSGNMYANIPLWTDWGGRTYLVTSNLSWTDVFAFAMHIIVLGPDGTPLDTVPRPSSDFTPPDLVARHTTEGGSMSTTRGVPFNAGFSWAVHPSGHFLTGLSTDYRVELGRDDGVLRIERAQDPIPVSDAERSHYREQVVRGMRQTQPDWSWDGPPIPENKPPFKDLVAGRDGRIWVLVSTEGYAVENEDHDPDDPSSVSVTWREPIRYDVFESDGTYLGAVVVPDDFSRSPEPVLDGDYVWAVTRDELEIERVVRYRIEVGGDC